MTLGEDERRTCDESKQESYSYSYANSFYVYRGSVLDGGG